MKIIITSLLLLVIVSCGKPVQTNVERNHDVVSSVEAIIPEEVLKTLAELDAKTVEISYREDGNEEPKMKTFELASDIVVPELNVGSSYIFNAEIKDTNGELIAKTGESEICPEANLTLSANAEENKVDLSLCQLVTLEPEVTEAVFNIKLVQPEVTAKSDEPVAESEENKPSEEAKGLANTDETPSEEKITNETPSSEEPVSNGECADIQNFGDMNSEVEIIDALVCDIKANPIEDFQTELSTLVAELENVKKGIKSTDLEAKCKLIEPLAISEAELVTKFSDLYENDNAPEVSEELEATMSLYSRAIKTLGQKICPAVEEEETPEGTEPTEEEIVKESDK